MTKKQLFKTAKQKKVLINVFPQENRITTEGFELQLGQPCLPSIQCSYLATQMAKKDM